MTTDPALTPEPIPPMETAKDAFHTPAELRDRWRALMGPLGFSERLLWFVFVDATGHLLPALNQLELTGPPDPDLADLLMYRLADVIDGQDAVRVAMMLSRPGTDGISPWDRGWVRLLTTAAETAGVPIEPVFRANGAAVVAVPLLSAGRRSVA